MHTYILRYDLDKKLNLVFNRINAKGRELNGQVSSEYVIGFAKKNYLKQ